MGAEPWHYFTPYKPDLNAVLQDLKEQEFRAGRYGFDYYFSQDIIAMQTAGIDVSDVAEAWHEAVRQSEPSADELIEEYGSLVAAMAAVFEESAPDGTYSILDMLALSDQPEICAACPLSADELRELFQTTEPTREMVENFLLNEASIDGWQPWESFWEAIGRGEGRYIIAYHEGQPAEVFFAGYSFD